MLKKLKFVKKIGDLSYIFVKLKIQIQIERNHCLTKQSTMIIKKKRIYVACTILILTISTFNLQASRATYRTGYDTTRNKSIEFVRDNPIIAMLDSMAQITFNGMPDFSKNREALNKYHYEPGYVPVVEDAEYVKRLEKLNQNSPFVFVYNNQVRQYIDLYANKIRSSTERILGMAAIYFPLFEEQLDRYNLPLELKYLPVIESALNPTAKSHAGAAGLWQFMFGTGKMYDLGVNSYVDDRFDPYKATDAACRHLKDLYAIYHDWALVLAAYNAGAGNVNRAVRKANGVLDYWVVQRFLPRETQQYVPAFIAASYVMHYSAEHNLFPNYPGILASEIDTVTVRKVLSFDQISEMFSIPVENLRFLNPGYTKDIIPASEEKTYFLRLPLAYVADFINNEEALYTFRTQKNIEKEKLIAQLNDNQTSTLTHVVKKGETLAQIAKKYRCSVTNLKKWNGLKKNTVKPRTELLVYVSKPQSKSEGTKPSEADSSDKIARSNAKTNGPSGTVDTTVLMGPPTLASYMGSDWVESMEKKQEKSAPKISSPKGKTVYHTIRRGDTLWSIANKYKGVTIDQIKKWNNLKTGSTLKPGQKIKIAVGNG